MEKKPLIGVSICAVVLLVLGSLTNVVGYQTIQTSQQNVIKERINQRELVFQIICDIANNKEIQRIILKSQVSRGMFPTSEIPVVTKNQLRQMYFLGVILSKVISKLKMQSMIGKYQFGNQEMPKEISGIIEKDTTINSEIKQLKDSECDCENKSTMNMTFPVVCFIIGILIVPIGLLYYLSEFLVHSFEDKGRLLLVKIFNFSEMVTLFLSAMLFVIGYYLNCWGFPLNI